MRRKGGLAHVALIVAVLSTAIATVLQCYVDYKQSMMLKAKMLALLTLVPAALGLLTVIIYAAMGGRK